MPAMRLNSNLLRQRSPAGELVCLAAITSSHKSVAAYAGTSIKDYASTYPHYAAKQQSSSATVSHGGLVC